MKLSKLPSALSKIYQLSQLELPQLHDASKSIVPVIVSFTSIPSRFNVIHHTIKSILNGSVKPEIIILWLNDKQKGKLPTCLTSMIGVRFEIRFVSEDSPHLKLIRSLISFPNKIIVTCDDDLLYEQTWLETLFNDHVKYPKDIIAHETRAIVYGENRSVLPYSYWYREKLKNATYDALMPLGFGGVLYPPGCFYSDVCDEELYIKLTPKADDLWFKLMSFLNGTKSRQSSNPPKKPTAIPNSQSVSLRSFNINQDGNRIQWLKLVEYYSVPPFNPWVIDQTVVVSPKAMNETKSRDARPIDAVITWVDGNDARHKAKLNAYLESTGRKATGPAKATRFNDVGELSYCVLSILKHAPWLRYIYIVSDDQTPRLMDWVGDTPYSDRIRIVDHKTIFEGYEQFLPTFNSRSIGAMIWRIPELSDQFLYFNDDMFLTKPVEPEDFFRKEKMVLRGYWRTTRIEEIKNRFIKALSPISKKMLRKTTHPKNKLAQGCAAQLCGFNSSYFSIYHIAYPMRVSSFREFYQQYPMTLSEQVSHPLRAVGQYTAEALAAHLEIKRGSAIIDNELKRISIKAGSDSRKAVKRKLVKLSKINNFPFVCVQSLDMASEKVQHLVLSRLLNMIRTIRISTDDN